MKVVNVHQRLLYATPEQVSVLLAALGSGDDRLWPARWPRMRLDAPLAPGARGGHGPIRYRVASWAPGRGVLFRFEDMPGVAGTHGLEILQATRHHCVLEHRLEARLGAVAWLGWVAVFRPLHDACVEDALSRAQATLGAPGAVVPWSPYVRMLRWALARLSRGGRPVTRTGTEGAAGTVQAPTEAQP
jgi:hypothetical protein